MKTLLAALAAVMLVGAVATATPARADCWWDGFKWHCGYWPHRVLWRHHHLHWRHHLHHRRW
ncbi:MAG TPA: hypothetical protein VJR70_08850 [Stellaceae bacterium]|nr:hypothetical protein [Stellaceae bacterium]